MAVEAAGSAQAQPHAVTVHAGSVVIKILQVLERRSRRPHSRLTHQCHSTQQIARPQAIQDMFVPRTQIPSSQAQHTTSHGAPLRALPVAAPPSTITTTCNSKPCLHHIQIYTMLSYWRPWRRAPLHDVHATPKPARNRTRGHASTHTIPAPTPPGETVSHNQCHAVVSPIVFTTSTDEE